MVAMNRGKSWNCIQKIVFFKLLVSSRLLLAGEGYKRCDYVRVIMMWLVQVKVPRCVIKGQGLVRLGYKWKIRLG